MTKIIKIDGVIDPEMLENLAQQIEEQDVVSGDKLDILINSAGGSVDVGFALASLITQMQDDNIEVRAVANGKVWSAAILPFLACDERVATKGASLLVHNVTYAIPKDSQLSAGELSEFVENIEQYTDAIADFYEDHGVPSDIIEHLYNGGDMTIADNDLIDKGFITTFIESAQNVANFFKKVSDYIFPQQPIFSYINNYNQQFINQNNNTMTKTQMQAVVKEMFGDFKNEILNSVKQALNEAKEEEQAEAEPLNESAKLTPEKLAKLDGVLYETSAKIEGNEEVVALAHPAKDVEKDHFIIPIKADGEVVRLAEGDFDAEIDGEKFVIHSTGEDWYLHAKGSETNEVPASEEPKEPEETKTNEVPVPKPEDSKACNQKQSKAPQTKKTTFPTKSHASVMREYAERFGAGCVGK